MLEGDEVHLVGRSYTASICKQSYATSDMVGYNRHVRRDMPPVTTCLWYGGYRVVYNIEVMPGLTPARCLLYDTYTR